MKRFLSICLCLAVLGSLSAKTVYLNTGGSGLWNQAGAVFFAHSWGSADNDVKMSHVSSDLYSAVIPDGNNSVIFVRMPGGSTSLDWNKKWNQTADLSIPSGKNCYTITGWGDTDGSWSKYVEPTPDPEAAKFYITGDSALVTAAGLSSTKAWNADAIHSDADTYTLHLGAGEYQLKVTVDGTWSTARGYNDLTETANGLKDVSDDHNIGFQLAEAGDVKVTYTSSVFKLEGQWVPEAEPCESYGLLVDGEYVAGKRNTLQTEWTEYMLRGVSLQKGQKVQIYNQCAEAAWVIEQFAPTSFTFSIQETGGKKYYVIAEDGKYDFYIKFIFENDELFVSKQGTYTTAVRDQCTDVMMQAFYNESYNNSAPGVSQVGNTRWATLLPQAEEIGHYIDLIWLPPSAEGDGMGYHPKNYSNQNSNWGTRAELEALIAAFHEAGAKVVADIVINHCTGWTSWCDFPTFDFGEYGVFHPDASFICKNDEVNAEWNKESAGACWGTATGSYDDGENWDGARDWAHDMPEVQNMFKAYLKWMRNVMKYDGFRYDKGDGFNNWHHSNYNKAAGPYIAFMECYSGDDRIIAGIEGAERNLMALDFQTRWDAICPIAGFNYKKCAGSGLLGKGYGKYAVTFIDSHDWFLRQDNENEFGGRGNSLSNEMKDRLLQANAYILGMPGVPCIFYPHWVKYKEALKPMIEARKLAGVHSESAVYDEQAEDGGYQCTLQGKYGWLVLQLGNKTNHSGWGDSAYKLVAKGNGYAMWVNRTAPLPTDAEKVQGDKVQRTKYLQDGKLFIRVGGQIYDVTGKRIL